MEFSMEIIYQAAATGAVVGGLLKFMWGRIDKKFEQVDKRFEQVDKRFEQMDKKFDKIEERFDKIDGKLEVIEDRISRVENRVSVLETRFEERFPRKEPLTIEISDERMEKMIEKTMRMLETQKGNK